MLTFFISLFELNFKKLVLLWTSIFTTGKSFLWFVLLAQQYGTICVFILVLIRRMILAVDGLPIRRGNFGNIFASIEPAWGWISFEWNISILFIVLELNIWFQSQNHFSLNLCETNAYIFHFTLWIEFWMICRTPNWFCCISFLTIFTPIISIHLKIQLLHAACNMLELKIKSLSLLL